MFKLIKYLKPYLKQVILGPAFKLFEAILELTIPLLMAKLIDNGVKVNNPSYIYMMGGIMVAIAITGAGSAYICQYYASIASQGFGTSMRNLLFKKIQGYSFNELDKIGTPSLINRVTSDVNQLQLAVAMLIRLVVRVPFLCIGGLIMAMTINLKLSVILFITMPLFALIIYFIMSRTIPLYKTVQKKLDTLSVIIRENLSGVRVIRAFAKLDKERERFSKGNREYADMSIRVGKVSALLNPATTVIVNLGVAAILWFGGIQVYHGTMTQGEIIAYVNYINMILSALIVLANLVVTFTKAAASANRVNEILETQPSVMDSDDNVADVQETANVSEGVPFIEFRNVKFSYDGASDYALKNISFGIKSGQTVGIIGSTGSGKSTLVNLIARFYDTTDGQILINGLDVRNMKQHDLRDKIGLVPQKSVLFSGTIEENVKWGSELAQETDINWAAGIAQAKEFIKQKSEGIKSHITQGGANLSGGQKQRLAIARAVVKRPELLILDDSTSALDYATDAALRREIKNNLKELTIIMVTQRVAAIRDADSIVVLDDGEMVGIGRNDELLESCPVYQEIYYSQRKSEVAHT
ncbi:ABC transporter related protein [Ruminiclostridium papyrosolvens DSM 2782]|uniref:ABC transporter related protein n=1 Tax=Ruminiclostridium papyrosolvens DSM 2782 TaxID=588581 RepID=F1TEK4_9FIRM|nr:ABC transporter ATP-binding protein [Ruminiclostridium papyrosolvens]EGD47170.1 ABC transporter related protein [Ruminiclostridium papyrosolvens DSM 2782]WES36210.1 ABC transporter ATP-binding protein [Ruminiclostridium papyrosolvens DSM 2782]